MKNISKSKIRRVHIGSFREEKCEKRKKEKEIGIINKWMCMRDRVLQHYKVYK